MNKKSTIIISIKCVLIVDNNHKYWLYIYIIYIMNIYIYIVTKTLIHNIYYLNKAREAVVYSEFITVKGRC